MFTLLKNQTEIYSSNSIAGAVHRFNLEINRLKSSRLQADTLTLKYEENIIAQIKPGAFFYNTAVFQPDIEHWFHLNPSEKQKEQYYACQAAIATYANRCFRVLSKYPVISADLKPWLIACRDALQKNLPQGSPYALKAEQSLSLWNHFTRKPEERDSRDMLRQLRYCLLYCHTAIFADTTELERAYYLQPKPKQSD